MKAILKTFLPYTVDKYSLSQEKNTLSVFSEERELKIGIGNQTTLY